MNRKKSDVEPLCSLDSEDPFISKEMRCSDCGCLAELLSDGFFHCTRNCGGNPVRWEGCEEDFELLRQGVKFEDLPRSKPKPPPKIDLKDPSKPPPNRTCAMCGSVVLAFWMKGAGSSRWKWPCLKCSPWLSQYCRPREDKVDIGS